MKRRRRRRAKVEEAELDDLSEAPPDQPPPPLGGRPEIAVLKTFMLGGVIASTPLGFFAMLEEHPGDVPGQIMFGMFLVGTLIQALFWGAILFTSFKLRARWAVPLLVFACLIWLLPTVGGVFLFDIKHPPTLLFPVSTIFAFASTPVLLLSFIPVLVLARRVRAAEPGQTTLDVSAAGFFWAAAVAVLGLSLSPGAGFVLISVLALVLAVLGLRDIHARVSFADVETGRGAELARATLLRGLRNGAPGVLLIALVLVPLRVRERALTRSPAVRAIYRAGLAGRCDVRPAGREGDVSLWLIDCGSSKGPVIGWDERQDVLLEGDKLEARVPKAQERR